MYYMYGKVRVLFKKVKVVILSPVLAFENVERVTLPITIKV